MNVAEVGLSGFRVLLKSENQLLWCGVKQGHNSVRFRQTLFTDGQMKLLERNQGHSITSLERISCRLWHLTIFRTEVIPLLHWGNNRTHYHKFAVSVLYQFSFPQRVPDMSASPFRDTWCKAGKYRHMGIDSTSPVIPVMIPLQRGSVYMKSKCVFYRMWGPIDKDKINKKLSR